LVLPHYSKYLLQDKAVNLMRLCYHEINECTG